MKTIIFLRFILFLLFTYISFAQVKDLNLTCYKDVNQQYGFEVFGNVTSDIASFTLKEKVDTTLRMLYKDSLSMTYSKHINKTTIKLIITPSNTSGLNIQNYYYALSRRNPNDSDAVYLDCQGRFNLVQSAYGDQDTNITLPDIIHYVYMDSAETMDSILANVSNADYIDSVASLKLDKSALGDSLISARKPFLQVVLDSSIVSTTDTIPLGYLSESFTIDSLIVISYGSFAPNLTYQIYHSGSTAMFSSSQTKNTKGTTKIVSFNDATLTSEKVYLVFTSVTSMPTRGKLAFYLIGHK